MKEKIKKWLKPVLFTAGGALVGLAYYYFVGCSTGACPLTSNPFITMAYMGFIGLDRNWLPICLLHKHRRKPNPQKPPLQQHKR